MWNGGRQDWLFPEVIIATNSRAELLTQCEGAKTHSRAGYDGLHRPKVGTNARLSFDPIGLRDHECFQRRAFCANPLDAVSWEKQLQALILRCDMKFKIPPRVRVQEKNLADVSEFPGTLIETHGLVSARAALENGLKIEAGAIPENPGPTGLKGLLWLAGTESLSQRHPAVIERSEGSGRGSLLSG